MTKYIKSLFLVLAFAAVASAVSLTTLSQLPTSSGGVFTQDNLNMINTNATSANTNFTAINAALAGLPSALAPVTCGTAAGVCANTAITALRVVQGTATLTTGSPSTAAITGISPAFTSAASYTCTAQDATTIANNVGVLTAGYVSGSAVTFTGPNTVTDVIRYTCIGF